MKAHELANLLLTFPDFPIAIAANGHVYASGADEQSSGKLQVGELKHYGGVHIVIGNMLLGIDNKPNWHTSKIVRRGFMEAI